MKILSFDPGGTTGWAIYDDGKWVCGQIGPEDHHRELWTLIDDQYRRGRWLNTDFRLVCESFEYRNGLDKAELMSCEYIGVVKLYAQWHDLHLTMQTASTGKIREDKLGRKGSFTQKRHLQKLGLWSSGNQHAMDAYGHLLYNIIHKTPPGLQDLRRELLVKAWKS